MNKIILDNITRSLRSTCGFQIKKRSFLCKEHGSGREELFEQESLTFIFPLFGSGSLKYQIVSTLPRRK
jgi:hypothetical protein